MVSGPRAARGRAHARAALVGNPSDGYGGRTIGVAIPEFAAEVEVREAPRVEVIAAEEDSNSFADLGELVADVTANGYYGGLRLVKAALKRFADHCATLGHPTPGGFSVSYSTTIPRQVGMGGSSAIVIATLRALCDFHAVTMPPAVLARLALSAESELAIPAGLQDRVIQAFGGLLYMDFADESRDDFEPLDPGLLPELFIAYRDDASEPSAAVHSTLRARFDARDRVVVETMKELAGLAHAGREALLERDHERLGRLMRANVDARSRLIRLDPRHLRMVEVADSFGAPANYTGSGGAIVGIVPDGRGEELRTALANEGCGYLQPDLAAAVGN